MSPLTAGLLLGRTFSIYFRNFVPITAIGVIVNLPSLALLAHTLRKLDLNDPVAWADRLEFLGRFDMILGFCTGALAAGAISFGVIRDLRGERAPLGAWLSKGLACMPRILLISLISGLVTAGGLLLLIIPGLIALTTFCVGPVVGVVERLGGTEALRRAADLSRGHRMTLFLAYFGVGILTALPMLVVSRWMAVPQVGLDLTLARVSNGLIVSNLLGLVTGGLVSTLPAVAYHALRTSKEGVDTDAIARVFD